MSSCRATNGKPKPQKPSLSPPALVRVDGRGGDVIDSGLDILAALDVARGEERYTRIVRERDGVLLAQRWGTAAGAPVLGRTAEEP